jgi:hypothetical protein
VASRPPAESVRLGAVGVERTAIVTVPTAPVAQVIQLRDAPSRFARFVDDINAIDAKLDDIRDKLSTRNMLACGSRTSGSAWT